MLVQAERVHRFKGGGVAARETNVGGSLGNERGGRGKSPGKRVCDILS